MGVTKYISNLPSLKGKTIIVTGGTSGIGYAYSEHAIFLGAKLVLLSFTFLEGQEAKNKLLEKYPDGDISIIEYNQANYESITNACNLIKKQYPDFDILVANAGVLARRDYGLAFGYPYTIGVNFFGAKLLIENLASINDLPHRFIIQGSFAAADKINTSIDLKDKNIAFFKQYNISKVLVESLFYEYTLSNPYPHLEFILTEPGLSSTNIISSFPKFIRVISKWGLKLITHSPQKASLTLLLASTEKAKHGDYIIPRGLFSLSGYPKIKKLPKKRYQKEILDKAK